MSTLKNFVQLIGNIGSDPELKSFESGKSLVSFSLATNEFYRKADGEATEETQWHKLVAWGKTAEYINANCKKGQQMLIQGKLQHRSYDDKEGNKRFLTEIVIHNCMKLSRETQPA